LQENTEKSQKGFNFKEKEFVKKLIEKVGMLKILNIADYANKRKNGQETSLDILCDQLVNQLLISKEELDQLKSFY
jgi:hypothetical protein